jgi:hypothetical protein
MRTLRPDRKRSGAGPEEEERQRRGPEEGTGTDQERQRQDRRRAWERQQRGKMWREWLRRRQRPGGLRFIALREGRNGPDYGSSGIRRRCGRLRFNRWRDGLQSIGFPRLQLIAARAPPAPAHVLPADRNVLHRRRCRCAFGICRAPATAHRLTSFLCRGLH